MSLPQANRRRAKPNPSSRSLERNAKLGTSTPQQRDQDKYPQELVCYLAEAAVTGVLEYVSHVKNIQITSEPPFEVFLLVLPNSGPHTSSLQKQEYLIHYSTLSP
jgi:hypothetical protein